MNLDVGTAGFWQSAVRSQLTLVDGVHSSSPPQDMTNAYNIVCENLHEMQLAMRTLRERQNSLIPIARLPHDILAQIFIACRDQDCNSAVRKRTPESERKAGLGWIQVSHVCRDWRAIALERHDLWTHIPFYLGTEWIEEAFSRSHLAPLVIIPRFNRSERKFLREFTDQHAALIIEHFARIKTLVFVVNTSREPESHAIFNSPSLSSSAPLLESLEIISDPNHRGRSTIISISDEFLGRHAPLLRSLLVKIISAFPWASPVLHNLVHLKLEFIASISALPSFNELLDALHSMRSSLQTLHLFGDKLWSEDISAETTRIIELSSLVELSYGQGLSECTTFLSHIQAPTTARLVLVTDTIAFDSADVRSARAFSSALATFLRVGAANQGARPISQLNCTHRPEATTLYLWSTDAYNQDDRQPFAAQRYEEPIVTVSYWMPAFDLAQAFCEVFVSPHLHDLYLSGDRWGNCVGWGAGQWRAMLLRAEDIREVSTSHNAVAALLEALWTGDIGTVGTDGVQAPIPCPKLKVLRLVSVDYRRQSPSPVFDILKRCLLTRSASGCPIESVSISSSQIEQNMVDELEKLVCTFKYDTFCQVIAA